MSGAFVYANDDSAYANPYNGALKGADMSRTGEQQLELDAVPTRACALSQVTL
jgi:hypothetical protein